ncbi:MAG: hypothetical protein IAE91_05685 [Ignavibacteriaceae bacterium]|nr:hypothetical protein [Ignavibacteriaceae bacterium]
MNKQKFIVALIAIIVPVLVLLIFVKGFYLTFPAFFLIFVAKQFYQNILKRIFSTLMVITYLLFFAFTTDYNSLPSLNSFVLPVNIISRAMILISTIALIESLVKNYSFRFKGELGIVLEQTNLIFETSLKDLFNYKFFSMKGRVSDRLAVVISNLLLRFASENVLTQQPPELSDKETDNKP